MRFPRINRLRWDKPPRDADRLETLEKMLDKSSGEKVLALDPTDDLASGIAMPNELEPMEPSVKTDPVSRFFRRIAAGR